MQKHILNTNIQLFLFPGIGILGLIICFFTKDINLMPIFYGVSLFSRSFFHFLVIYMVKDIGTLKKNVY